MTTKANGHNAADLMNKGEYNRLNGLAYCGHHDDAGFCSQPVGRPPSFERWLQLHHAEARCLAHRLTMLD